MHISLALVCYAASLFSSTVGNQTWGVTSSSDAADGQTFDYIVVGGGLSGITVAARLSENPALRILLIEAGGDNRTNPEVYNIFAFGQAYGGPLDWNWPTDMGRNEAG